MRRYDDDEMSEEERDEWRMEAWREWTAFQAEGVRTFRAACRAERRQYEDADGWGWS